MRRGARLLLAAAALVGLVAGCKSKLDLATPRKYPCTVGGGEAQCPSGWRCGLEGTCHDRGLAAPYQCATDDDCELEWHCGKAQRCYDRADAGAIECRPEVPEDCADGWRCGRTGTCHDRSVGTDYECRDDVDCEQEWRCDSLVGRCVDSRADALRDLEPGPVRQTRISPLTPALPEQFAASGYFSLDDEDAGISAPWTRSLSYVTDGGLTFVLDVWRDTQTNYMQTERVPLPAGPARGLASYLAATYLLDDQGVWRYTHSLDGGHGERLAFPGFPATQLRIARGADYWDQVTPAVVYAFDAHRLAFYDPADGGSALVPLPDAGAAELYDLIETRYSSSYPQHFFASTSGGLYWARRDWNGFLDGPDAGAPTWVALDLPGLAHPACGAQDGGYRALRIHADYDYYLRLVAESAPRAADAGASELMAFVYDEPYTLPPAVDCGSDRWSLLAPPTRACGQGERLLDFHPSDIDSEFAQTRCRFRAPDGGEGEHSYFLTALGDGGFVPVLATALDDPYGAPAGARTTPSFGEQARAGFADEFGRFWYGTDESDRAWLDDYRPWADVEVLPVAPAQVVGGESSLLAFAYRPYKGQFSSYTYELDPAVGLLWSGPRELQLCGPVRGQSDWVVRTAYGFDEDGGVLNSGPPPVEILPLSQALDGGVAAPVTLSSTGQLGNQPCGPGSTTTVVAVRATLPDGGTELLVAGNDTVWAGDITPVLGAADAGRLVLDAKLVPSPRIRIDDLVALAPDPDGGELVGGYVLAQQRLFRFAAANETRWRADEVTLPPGDPTVVWADGRAGRVGYRDGRVYSLPSRVLIAPALTLPGGLGVEFGAACARIYALAQDGVYRLQKTADAGVGTWEPADLALAAPGGLDDGAAGGQFYPTARSLYFFSAKGVTVKLEGEGCR